MATHILDKDKVLELLKKYRPAVIVNETAGGTSSFRFLCPFHSDNNPSFVFSLMSSKGKCFACGRSASLEDVVAQLDQIPVTEAKKTISSCYKSVVTKAKTHKVNSIDISVAQVNLWHVALESDFNLQKMMKRWGWTKEVTNKYLIGSAEGKLTIPMFEGEQLVGLKYYSPGSSTKYQNATGSNQLCWPLENLNEDEVYLVEGEKDCITMLSAGFNAVSFTTGANSVPKEYVRFFAGKVVYIIYDIDEAGRSGAVNAANILSFATKKVHIVDLPLDGIPKGDLTDAYMQDPEVFVDFIKNICANSTQYKAPSAYSKVSVPSEVYDTYLEDIVDRKLFYRRVHMKVRVVSQAREATSIVPQLVHVTCNKDYKDYVCQTCPIFYKTEPTPLYIKPEYPELMSMIKSNGVAQHNAIKSMLDINLSCTKVKVDQKKHQALYPIVIIPAIEANKPHHNYTLVKAWVLDVPAQDNEDFDVEGVVIANPDTQDMEIVCYRMDRDVTSLDSFELTPEMIDNLRVFSCTNLALSK